MKAFRQDDYASAMLGRIGAPWSGQPFAAAAALGSLTFRSDAEAFSIYATNGLAGRIVDMPADDSTARGFVFEGDIENAVADEFERLNVQTHGADCVRWSRLVGGGAMVLLTDGDRLTDPLAADTLHQIVEIRTFDATQFSVASRYLDETQASYGQPETYQIASAVDRVSFRVHESRVIPVTGAPLPSTLQRTRNVPWRGRSALDGCMASIEAYSAALAMADRLLERKQQAVYAMSKLAERLQSGVDPLTGRSGIEDIQDRVTAVDLVRGALNTVAVDSDDKYEIRDLNLGGVQQVINEKQIAVSADSGIVVALLFGRSPAGQNSTGDADKDSYSALTGGIQRNDLGPALRRLGGLIVAQRTFPKDKRPKTLKIKFNPLWTPSEKELAETRLANGNAASYEAQAAAAYNGMGALSPDAVARDLGARGLYGLTPETAVAEADDTLDEDPPTRPNYG